MKRYQVFVSSTYEDLKVERSEVFHGLLDIECIPCGMEYFPASSESQWDYIKRIIDDCDYYVVISAGKYGSLGPGGISYTQMEYEYALEKGIPTLSFLYRDLGSLLSAQTETAANKKKKLDAFRTALQGGRLCKFWTTPLELRAAVTVSLTAEKQNNPRIGWVRADATNEETTKEMLGLYKENHELKERLAALDPNADTSQYEQGSDMYTIKFQRRNQIESIDVTWNDIISILLPLFAIDHGHSDDYSRVQSGIRRLIGSVLKEEAGPIQVLRDSIQTIFYQLIALRYLELDGEKAKLTRSGQQKLAHSWARLRDATSGEA